MKIALGGDHAGVLLKAQVGVHLSSLGHEVDDFGTDDPHMPVDYPYYCARVARAVAGGEASLGIVFGGTGQGEQIAANKVPGIRAAVCESEYTARFARRHNDANVLALGARVLATELALAIVDVFISEPFDGGRHLRRVEQIRGLEREENRKREEEG